MCVSRFLLSIWKMKSTCHLFAFFFGLCVSFLCSTDCGEGSREGRSWTAGQKESQLWEEEKLQVRHCCRFLRRNLIRKVSQLLSLSLSCVHTCARLKQFGNNNNQPTNKRAIENWVGGRWEWTRIWCCNSSWKSWKISRVCCSLFL